MLTKNPSNLSCMGENTTNQLNIPPNLINYTLTVSLGYDHSCAVSYSGRLQCWGSNRFKQSDVPALFFTTGAKMVSSGNTHSCGVDRGGGVKCWGMWHTKASVHIPSMFMTKVAFIVSGGY